MIGPRNNGFPGLTVTFDGPVCDCADASQAVVLRVQYDLAVSAHHARRTARLLHPKRLRREGLYG